MIIDCISDLHGALPKLEGGDLLIIAGDLTASDKLIQYEQFFAWLELQSYTKKVVIPGNHDKLIAKGKIPWSTIPDGPTSLLLDSGTEFQGLKIWGNPWTRYFLGVNPHCDAFMWHHGVTEQEKLDLIPPETDILITHSPPKGILDHSGNSERYGSRQLADWVMRFKPKLHIFGHIHEGYGRYQSENTKYEPTIFINAALMNIEYDPVNLPIRLVI